ncbi:hypothetical protein VF02_20420 [Nostoc linckia z1]|uniref:hypothetical protein n=2 Tax=Nostoc linckia TaxID=92942 RepID=UPI000BFF8834|nr:hypothetical protein [Nostoc linckia]PHJ61152.1 hypothetical protein VF02_20420 [Nostoc linckia z1]
MLCAFPDPYPGELVYSICARFQERVQYPSLRSTVEDLFQTKNAIAGATRFCEVGVHEVILFTVNIRNHTINHLDEISQKDC